MKRLLFVISSILTIATSIACDAEYVEQAHHAGKVQVIVAAAIAVVSWIIGLWNRLGAKARCLLRSFGLVIAFNIAVIGIGNLSELATDYNDTLFAQISIILLLLLPIIDITWIILTFVLWSKKGPSKNQ